jgi:hypothetical protein
MTVYFLCFLEFIGSESFYNIKEELDKSPLLALLREMPKGGTLHSHLDAIAPFDWLIKTFTYDPNVYIFLDEEEEKKKSKKERVTSCVPTDSGAQFPGINSVWCTANCFDGGGSLSPACSPWSNALRLCECELETSSEDVIHGTFKFMTAEKAAELNTDYGSSSGKGKDKAQGLVGPWYNVVELRESKPDPELFDEWLLSLVTLGQAEVDAGDVWTPFQQKFIRVAGLTFYEHIFPHFVHKVFESAKADHLQFLEFRTLPITLYGLDGATTVGPVEAYRMIRGLVFRVSIGGS